MIKKGVIGIDDYAHFGRLVDEISSLAYAIMLVPRKSRVIVITNKSNRAKVEEIAKRHKVKIEKSRKLSRGGLANVILEW